MIIFVFLVLMLVISVFLLHSPRPIIELFGVIMTVSSGFYLMIHITLMSISSYSYDLYLFKRTEFEKSLEQYNKDKTIKSSIILEERTKWNNSLEIYKNKNKKFFYKDYIDNRFEDLNEMK